jgi:hypothetical protein
LLRCEPVIRSHLCELQAIEFVCVGDVPNTTSCMCSTHDRVAHQQHALQPLLSPALLWHPVCCVVLCCVVFVSCGATLSCVSSTNDDEGHEGAHALACCPASAAKNWSAFTFSSPLG